VGVIVIVSSAIVATPAFAQERLVGQQSAGVGASVEAVTFGGQGLRQYNFIGLDSSRVLSVRQVSTPITTAWALNQDWHVDVTALYANASVKYRDASGAGATRTATLSGVSDVRVRATGTIVRERLVLTAGANLPTGHTSLSNDEFGVLRIMAAPSLGLGSTPVGAGPSGTMGVIVARRAGPWAMAMGGSYEYRGRYSPVAALVAGAPSADFQPGGVIRASVTGDRTVGPHRLSVAVSADVFSDDELKTPTSTGVASASTKVRLGPVMSSDVQMLFAAPRFRQLMGYASFRWRAPFARNGTSVDKSSGQYFDSGLRAALSLGPQRDLVLAADTRLHTGLGVDEGLPTAGVASGSLSAGLEVRRGLMSLQPYTRVQSGVLRQRGVVGAPTQAFSGVALGLVAVARF
jgi:hypothetical protein